MRFPHAAWLLMFALQVALLLQPSGPALAQDSAQAGLVIVTGSGAPATYCVELAPDESITGNELLERAGVKVVADQNAMGASICSLNGTGCNFPAQSCFCQCEGMPCTYWSYWRQDEAGAWQYATAGATTTRIRAGMVEGWVWGEGTTQNAIAPPDLTLADLCTAPESATIEAAVGAPQPLAQVDAAPSTTAAPLETAPAAAAEATTSQSNNQWALAGFAALVVIPVVALLLLRRRKEEA